MDRNTPSSRRSWHKQTELPNGMLADATPAPGRTYTRATWPPRGRGRGESLDSPRRIAAKLRTIEIIRLRRTGATWEAIAGVTGFKDASGPYRAYKRALDRLNWDEMRREELRNFS